MMYFTLGFGVLFILIAFLVHEGNAHVLLAGYNTMSEEDRAAFDLKGFMHLFKWFHVALGSIIVIGGLGFELIDSELYQIYLVGVLPVFAYMYFILKTKHFNKPEEHRKLNWAAVVLGILGVIITLLGIYTDQGNALILEEEQLVITGLYGEEIPYTDIDEVVLLDSLPAVKIRVNGSAVGGKLAGHFTLKDGRSVKLFVDRADTQFLSIKTKAGKDIIYSSTSVAEEYTSLIQKL